MGNEIGEYGRTNLGNIIKFAWFQNSETGETYKNKVILVDKMMTETYPFYYFKKDEYIVKHSKDLEDLLEIGDIIEYIDDVEADNTYQKNFIVRKVDLKAFQEYLKAYCKVISVCTKEQFESISYKVKTD